MLNQPFKNALTIAGSDASGGAGIQADLRSFRACGLYGLSVITAITAQNTQGVQAVEAVSTDMVYKQLDAILSDIEIETVKIGMLCNSDIIAAVFDRLRFYKCKKILLDPVLISSSGKNLLESSAIKSLQNNLKYCDIITPNIDEAQALLNLPIKTSNQQKTLELSIALAKNYDTAVITTCGHLQDNYNVNSIVNNKGFLVHSAEFKRVSSKHTHGTGCVFSSVFSAIWAKTNSLETALNTATNAVSIAVKNSALNPISKNGVSPVQLANSIKII